MTHVAIGRCPRLVNLVSPCAALLLLSGCAASDPPADAGFLPIESDPGALDGGNCIPAGTTFLRCVEDPGEFAFCKPTVAGQRSYLCSFSDAGAYFRGIAFCDGGVVSRNSISGLGPHESCMYADGALIGASLIDDTNSGRIHGAWARFNFWSECQTVALCP